MNFRFSIAVLASWNLALLSVCAQEPGDSLFGRNDYVEYRVGDLPLILTSGHGGDLRPSEIPDRTWGVTGRDRNTRELTVAIAAEIFQRTGRRPHVVISHLHRIKLDPNREIVEAAQGSIYAEQAWEEFHGFIRMAREAAEAAFDFGFLVDVHGHGHDIQRIELGYALGGSVLNLSDAELESPGRGWGSSLRTLMLRRPGVPFPEMLRGPRSLGQLLNERGVPSWPSEDFPSPGSAPFFSGGYITRQHTCLIDNGPINGVQVECYFTGVRDTAANRAAFAVNFADVLQPYLWDNYDYSIGTRSLYRPQPAATNIRKGGPLAVLTVEREGYRDYASAIDLAFGGSAALGDDYTVSSSSITFASNQQTAQIAIFPAAPNGELGDKTIEVRLVPSGPQSADTAPVVFTLGDGVSQTVRVRPAAAEVWESDGQAHFLLTRTATGGALEVSLEWDGTAIPGLDYDFPWELPATATFNPGVGEIAIPVAIVNDAVPEPDKEIVLRVLPGSGYVVGHPGEAVLLLRDDDRPHGIEIWLRGESEANRLLDSSGLERHATTLPAGRGPVAIETVDGTAISFDGVEATAALPKLAPAALHQFSIAFFFRLGSASGDRNFLSFGERGDPGSLNIYLTSATNLRTWLVPAGGSASASARDVSGAFASEQWIHYALTVDVHGTSRVYIDGQLRRANAGWTPPLDPLEVFWLGWRRQSGGGSGFLSGQLRDFRLYGRALSGAEVMAVAEGRHTFDSWRQERGLPAEATSMDDLDDDGMSLLLEYALGANPTIPGRPPRYGVRMDGDGARLTFLRHAAAKDLTWRVEATGDLSFFWETVAEKGPGDSAWSVAPGVVLSEENGLVTVADNLFAGGAQRRFLRLRVDLTGP